MNTTTKSYSVVAGLALVTVLGIYLLLVRLTGTAFAGQGPTINLNSVKFDQLDNVMPVVIIGSGPAGLAAGVYTSRAGIATLIIEGKKPGGLLTETTYVENWPGEEKILGKELMLKFKQQNQALGVQFLADIVERVDFKVWPYQVYTSDGFVIKALSVMVATGASPRFLGVLGEQQYWSHGVSSCAVCDAPFYKNKEVVVVGGGDSAAEQVLQLAPHAKSVTMIVRKNQLRACKNMQEKVAAISNAKILFNSQITQIYGDLEKVTGIELLNNQDQTKQKIDIDGVFLAIGHDPASQIFKKELEIDQDGYIILQAGSQKTSLEGIFAAGEVVDHVYRQAGVAAGDGIKAGLEAVSFLQALGFNADFAKKLNYFSPNKIVKPVLKEITTLKEFEDQVLNSKMPAVLDFYTDYCSACLHMLPFYEKVAYELQDKMNLFKIDASASEELVRSLKIYRVPTILVYQSGEQKVKIQEALTKREMIDLFSKYIS